MFQSVDLYLSIDRLRWQLQHGQNESNVVSWDMGQGYTVNVTFINLAPLRHWQTEVDILSVGHY